MLVARLRLDPKACLLPIEEPLAEPARTRRSSRLSAEPAASPAPPLTRAELRRRAQSAATPAAPTPSLAGAAEAPHSGPALPEIDADALVVPHVATRETAVEAAAAALDAAATVLPAVPARRSRRRSLAPQDDMLELPPVVAADAVPAAGTVGQSADSTPAEPDALHDEFEAAARLFAFTAETPVQVAATALRDADEQNDVRTDAGRPARRFPFARVAATSFSVGVMGVVGLLAVGMTTPVGAVAAAGGTTAATSLVTPGTDASAEPAEIQAYIAPAGVENAAVERHDSFGTVTRAQIAADSGISNFSNFFTNDPTSEIQWPFAVGVPITYGFGMRSGRMHEGVDFVPGAGAPIQAIADGTVRIATESGGAFGVTVVIDHVVGGELVASRYGHMQYGSLNVVPGQQVTVGTQIGRVGNTGRSFGAHLHFEILAGGTTAIDPLPWLREHAGG